MKATEPHKLNGSPNTKEMKEKCDLFQNLFAFEMANNHMGDLKHGINIIREKSKVCKRFDFRFGF